jgi:malate permease and related proteins
VKGRRGGRVEQIHKLIVEEIWIEGRGPGARARLSIVLGLSEPARQAAILLAAMPTAVVTTVIALEFDLDPSFATSAVFVSTMLSPFSLVLIIAYLQRF